MNFVNTQSMNVLFRRPLMMSGRRGFSLIEVLIAVVVLALGLLGVGAVFPVVIRSQRQSQDVIMGKVAARAATAYILGRKDMIGALRELAYDPTDNNKVEDPPEFEASPWQDWKANLANRGGRINGYGQIQLPHPDPDLSSDIIYVPLSARLYPAPYTESADPQYVWDIALRRKKEGGAQVVVFTRRIDPQIGVPDDVTLSDVLLAPVENVGPWPVAVSDESNEGGLPTGTGRGAYSLIRKVEMINWGGDDTANRDRKLVMIGTYADDETTNTGNRFSIVRRAEVIGQRLVDNLGNVYTVTGTLGSEINGEDGSKAQWLEIEPPLSVKTIQQSVDGADIVMLMTPQVPASIDIIDIE
jgi:prepilin-type N-terminal cleavage/methylation domain-containing protein